jgi:hypothetical protein
LEEPSMPITYITPHWLTSMQDYMGWNNIELTKANIPSLSHNHDQYLMDNFWALNVCNDSQLYDLNACCLYLQATTSLTYWTVLANASLTRHLLISTSLIVYPHLKWPQLPFVVTKQRNHWKKALKAMNTMSKQPDSPAASWPMACTSVTVLVKFLI